MADKIVRDILIADATVTGLVDDRISPVLKQQGIKYPVVTLDRTELTPTNHLTGDAGLDSVLVGVRSWATTYKEARQVADACRAAIVAAGHLMQSERDNYEDGIDPGLYLITQEFQVWK